MDLVLKPLQDKVETLYALPNSAAGDCRPSGPVQAVADDSHRAS